MKRRPQRALRVMKPYAATRATSNPYIHMLDAALEKTPDLEMLPFDRKKAIAGRYDAIHIHWPETWFGGTTPARKAARRAFLIALRARLTVSRIALVRTVHNTDVQEPRFGFERRYLDWIEARADHRILLNDLTPVPAGSDSTIIPHGHYIDWFKRMPKQDAVPGTLAFVGMIRPYKGVEGLLDAFAETPGSTDDIRLVIAGSPIDAAIEREVRERAAKDSRVSLDLRYLSEENFALAVTGAAGVVLPYKEMHNSGTVLAALSLLRPVLAPRNDVVDALSQEVGAGWITTFDGEVTAADLQRFAQAVAAPPTTPPDLTLRGWAEAGEAHRQAFARAVARRRGDKVT